MAEDGPCYWVGDFEHRYAGELWRSGPGSTQPWEELSVLVAPARAAKFKLGGARDLLDRYDSAVRAERFGEGVPQWFTSAYNLGPERPEGFAEFIDSAPVLGGRVVPGGRIRMLTWLVTVRPGESEVWARSVFEAAYEFLVDLYGEDAVVGAWVHPDAPVPYLRFAFLPIDYDGKLRGSAVFDPGRLQRVHDALQEHLGARCRQIMPGRRSAGRELHRTVRWTWRDVFRSSRLWRFGSNCVRRIKWTLGLGAGARWWRRWGNNKFVQVDPSDSVATLNVTRPR